MVSAELAPVRETLPQRKRLIVFAGPEGSGKSTQGRILAKNLGLPFVSTGDMIRAKAAEEGESELINECREVVNNHIYLKEKYLNELVRERLSKEDIANGAVLDGALRTLGETEVFDQTLEKAGRGDLEVDVVFLRAPIWLGAQRLLGRGRDDDTPEGIQKRLTEFYKDLGKRMRIAKDRYNFYQVNSMGEVGDVSGKIMSVLNGNHE